MKETKNNTNSNIDFDHGYNICPACGRKAQDIMVGDIYYVGCPYRGMRNGVSTLVDEELTDDVKEQMRAVWNKKVLKSFLDPEALEMLDLNIGGYALTTMDDGHIIHTAEMMGDVMRYLDMAGDDKSYGIYLHIEGTLQYIGSTFLVWLIRQELDK